MLLARKKVDERMQDVYHGQLDNATLKPPGLKVAAFSTYRSTAEIPSAKAAASAEVPSFNLINVYKKFEYPANSLSRNNSTPSSPLTPVSNNSLGRGVDSNGIKVWDDANGGNKSNSKSNNRRSRNNSANTNNNDDTNDNSIIRRTLSAVLSKTFAKNSTSVRKRAATANQISSQQKSRQSAEQQPQLAIFGSGLVRTSSTRDIDTLLNVASSNSNEPVPANRRKPNTSSSQQPFAQSPLSQPSQPFSQSSSQSSSPQLSSPQLLALPQQQQVNRERRPSSPLRHASRRPPSPTSSSLYSGDIFYSEREISRGNSPSISPARTSSLADSTVQELIENIIPDNFIFGNSNQSQDSQQVFQPRSVHHGHHNNRPLSPGSNSVRSKKSVSFAIDEDDLKFSTNTLTPPPVAAEPTRHFHHQSIAPPLPPISSNSSPTTPRLRPGRVLRVMDMTTVTDPALIAIQPIPPPSAQRHDRIISPRLNIHTLVYPTTVGNTLWDY